MKRKLFNFSLLASIGLLVFGVNGLAACSSAPEVSNVSVRFAVESLNMSVGETTRLRASVSPKNYADVTPFWHTSNENVVRLLDDRGTIAAVGEGTAVVDVTLYTARAQCVITVGSGEVDPDAPVLTVSASLVNLVPGGTKDISCYVNPSDTNVEFTAGNPAVATVAKTDAKSAVITGIGDGETTITAVGSNGKTATVTVRVKTGGSTVDDDIAVSPTLHASGDFVIGSPKAHISFIKDMLKEFNELTESAITYTIKEMEENNGTGGLANAAAAPDVFAYASDQTAVLYQFEVLANLSSEDKNWIRDNMDADAYTSSILNGRSVGYPFAADNGVVMFYDKSVVSEGEIDTVDKLFAKADELGYEVDYNVADGFYGAGALMSFTQGQSLYTYTPDGKEYTSDGNFSEGDRGLLGAQLVGRLFDDNVNKGKLRSAIKTPGSKTRVVATIVSTSRAAEYRAALGENFGVAPLPYTDDSRTTRIGSYCGYKFYAVNKTLKGDKATTAASIAKFLASEYVQRKRFDVLRVQPTLNSLQSHCANEPHVQALNAQKQSKSTVLMTALNPEYWSKVGSFVTDLKTYITDNGQPDESWYRTKLASLDKSITKQ